MFFFLKRRTILFIYIPFPWFSVEAGRLSCLLDVSLKDEFQTCIGKLYINICKRICIVLTILELNHDDKKKLLCTVILHRNIDLAGRLQANVQQWQTHGLSRAYIETSLGIKVPTLPCSDAGEIEGYRLGSVKEKLATYFVALDTCK